MARKLKITNVMSERPILFNDEMVRAILEGRKTQTRRPINPQPECDRFFHLVEHPNGLWWDENICIGSCPYGKNGGQIWVRETHQIDNPHTDRRVCYRATESNRKVLAHKWRPSIHLPRWASRILLEITDIRVERVQDISEQDSIAEGVERINGDYFRNYFGENYAACSCAMKSFQTLWHSIYEKYGFAWFKNPWVWVIEFKVLETEAANV